MKLAEIMKHKCTPYLIVFGLSILLYYFLPLDTFGSGTCTVLNNNTYDVWKPDNMNRYNGRDLVRQFRAMCEKFAKDVNECIYDRNMLEAYHVRIFKKCDTNILYQNDEKSWYIQMEECKPVGLVYRCFPSGVESVNMPMNFLTSLLFFVVVSWCIYQKNDN